MPYKGARRIVRNKTPVKNGKSGEAAKEETGAGERDGD